MKTTLKHLCGDDDFLVEREAQQHLSQYGSDVDIETLDGRVQNAEELENTLKTFQTAARSLPLLGTAKCVYLKGLNAVSDTVAGRSQSAKDALKLWLEFLKSHIGQEETIALHLVVSLYPLDRRRREYKWLKQHSTFVELASKNGVDAHTVKTEAARLSLPITNEAATLLAGKTGHHRLLSMELEKLATYLNDGETADAPLVLKLVPDFGAGDFFEATEAFFSFDLPWGMDALRRQFFNDPYAGRPILISLQNRIRLMIQLHLLADSGDIALKAFNKDTFEQAATRYHTYFGDFDKKSSFNIFTQNLWYLGKLTPQATLRPLKKWVDYQLACGYAFDRMLQNPHTHLSTLEHLFIECLHKTPR